VHKYGSPYSKKYISLKNGIRTLFITETQNFILVCGVLGIALGVIAVRFVENHAGSSIYQLMNWELLMRVLAKEIVVIYAIAGAGLMFVVNRFYLKNMERYRLLPVAKNRILRSELMHTCSIFTIIVCGFLILYATIAKMNLTLIFQLLSSAIIFQFTNVIFPIIIGVYVYSKIKKMPFFLFLLISQGALVGQNILLFMEGKLVGYLILVFIELIIGVAVAIRIRNRQIVWEQPAGTVERIQKYRKTKSQKNLSLFHIILLENLSHYKILIQFMLLPAIVLLGMTLLGMETNMKMSKDFFAFMPAFFAAVFSTYQKQYRELPINEKKNIGIRLFIALVMTIGNYLLMTMVIQEKLNIAYFIDVICYSIVLFTCVIKMKIQLFSSGKENPMFYLFLGMAEMVNYFFSIIFIDTVYMLVGYPIPIYSSSLFLAVISIIVLVI